jgi:ribosome-associated protein
MKFELKDEYIELFKLLKVLDLVDSGAQAKMIVADGYVKRNGETELRKRAKIISGDILSVGDDVTIEVV